MSFPWKDEHIQTFLELYQNNECLWNNKSEDYHKINIRDKAYKSVLCELNLPNATVNDVKSKIKTIRTRYSSELAKIRKSERSGAGSKDLYVPRLFWFKQADSFLRDVCTPKASTSNMPESLDLNKHSKNKVVEILQETSQLEEDLNTDFQCEESENIENLAYQNNDPETPEQIRSQTITATPSSTSKNNKGAFKIVKNKRGSSSTVESIHGAIQKLTKLSDDNKNQKEIHEFDAFCNSLAIQLKKMPLQQALICQGKLQAVMTQHRLSALSPENSTSSFDMYTSTPSPVSMFPGQTSNHSFYPETSSNNIPIYQEESTNVLAQAISSISGFNT